MPDGSGGGSGDTYNEFSGNAQVVVQARTIVGGVHVRVDRELPPLSTRAFLAWLVVAAVPLTGAIIVGRYAVAHLHDRGGQASLGVAALAGLLAVRIGAVMWEWWTLSRDRQPDILERRLDRAVRGLARTLSEQWRTEERSPRNRLQDPHPLPVRWVDDDPDAQPDLAGTFGEIVDTFDRVVSRRLVILGSAGSGKSVLARRFALNWLTREPDGAAGTRPVPVILPLASWHPAKSLIDWAAARLASEHPVLGRRMLSGGTVAEALLRRGRLLPVLDGFDEIAPPLRADALQRLNQAFDEGVPVLLTSRPEEYRDAIDEAGVVFSAAAVVRLRPLDAPAVRDYLLTTTARSIRVGDRQVPKWQPVLDRLDTDHAAAAVRQALTTPLMVALARLAYNDTRADPAELLDADRFTDRASVEQHLLDRLVPTAYQSLDEPGDRVRWRATDAGRWLGFLARRMNAEGTSDLAWWRLGGRWTRYTAAGAIAVLVGGLTVMMAVLGYAGSASSSTYPLWVTYLLLAPLPITEAAMLVVANEIPTPTALAFGRGQARRMLLRLLLCVVVGLPAWALLHVSWMFLTIACGVVMVRGIPRPLLDVSVVTDPPASLRSDRRATVLLGLWYAVAGDGRRWRAAVVLLAPLALFWLWSQTGGADTDLFGQWWLVVAVTVVVLFGYGLLASAWGQFQLIRCVLAARGVLPWRVLGFLADAHRRGVLRQTGGVYQFRHARLQDRLAGTVRRTDIPAADQRDPRIPVLLSLIVILVGAVMLVGTTAGAPGAPGPYLAFAPVCDELRQELVPLLSTDVQVQSDGPATDFTCLLDGAPHAPGVDVTGYVHNGTPGVDGLTDARSTFADLVASNPSGPPTAGSCGEPVVYNGAGDVEMLCGNADFTVQYTQDGASRAQLNATAVTLAQATIGIALGDRAPVADNARARRAAIQALADRPRPLDRASGSARYRSGPEQMVTGATWQPGEPTALQDIGAFVFRTPKTLWCGRTVLVHGPDPAWDCATRSTNPSDGGYLTVDLAVWPCQGGCAPDQRTQVEQDWETYAQQQALDLTDVSWQLSDVHTAYAESSAAGRYQLLMIYLAHAADGRVTLVAAAVQASSGDSATAQKIVNDIRTQANV